MSVVPAGLHFTADLYDRLGLTAGADTRTIRQRFRRLARLYHPDQNPSPTAHERFLALQAAYDVLNSSRTRAEYERWLVAQDPPVRPIEMDVRPGPTSLHAGLDRQRLYLLVTFKTTLDQSGLESPVNLTLVLDCSSSMRGERLHQSKHAAYAITEQLGPRDVFAITCFNDRARVILPPHRGPQLRVVRSALEGLDASGGTEIAAGLETGFEQVRRLARPDVLSHLILLTDGQTYGDEARALELVDRARTDQIGFTALGIGNDWNDVFLDELAARACGRAHHIAQSSDAVAVFERRLHQLQQTTARNATLSFEPGPQVTVLEWHEVAPELRRLTPQAGAAMLGAVAAGPPLNVLIDLVVSSAHELLLVGDLSLQATLRQSGHVAHIQQPVVMTRQAGTGQMPPEIFEAAQRVAMLRLQERAWQAAAVGDVTS
ncbi:MAG TPA: hypothetical protein DEP84_31270, partial [Chloroflexi bacterium]|nr:hypothetical protein [Chloroflexota bacterium]